MSDVRGRGALLPTRVFGTLGVAMGVFTLVGACSAQVYLRGQGEAVVGDVLRVGPEGVAVKVGEASKIIGWDRVREVRGEHGAAAGAQAGMGETLWRARSRLERGDFGAAEGLLEGLAERARAAPGPTASVVFEGLLRCRLRRGAMAGAVWSWLDWVRARGGNIGSAGGGADPTAMWIGGRIEGSPVIDGATGLVVSMPPIFLRDSALDAAAGSDEWHKFLGTDATTAALAMLYRAAARFEAGVDPEIGEISGINESVRMVGDVVLARVGTDAQRQSARGSLEARLAAKEIEPWVECWCRAGIGRSLLREQDAEQRRQGVIQLLHVPARFVRVSPNLASIALAEAAVALHEMGDEAGSLAVKNELMDRFARSPAAGWARLREIHGPSDAPAKSAGAPGKGEHGAPEKQGN